MIPFGVTKLKMISKDPNISKTLLTNTFLGFSSPEFSHPYGMSIDW